VWTVSNKQSQAAVAGGRSGANCAKQTQLSRGVRKWAWTGRARDQLCETNPIPTSSRSGDRRSRGQLRQTNPSSAGQDAPPFHYSMIPPFQFDAYRAEQSQFRKGFQVSGWRRQGIRPSRSGVMGTPSLILIGLLPPAGWDSGRSGPAPTANQEIGGPGLSATVCRPHSRAVRPDFCLLCVARLRHNGRHGSSVGWVRGPRRCADGGLGIGRSLTMRLPSICPL